MATVLSELFADHQRCRAIDDWTHTDGSDYWRIEDEDMAIFLEEYSKFSMSNPERYHLRQCVDEIAQVQVEFHVPYLGDSSPITEELIQGMISALQHTVRDLCNNEVTRENYGCMVFVSNDDLMTGSERKKCKHHPPEGARHMCIRLSMFNVVMQISHVRKYLIPRYMNTLCSLDLYGAFTTRPYGNWEDMIKDQVYTQGFPVYGSTSTDYNSLSLQYSGSYIAGNVDTGSPVLSGCTPVPGDPIVACEQSRLSDNVYSDYCMIDEVVRFDDIPEGVECDYDTSVEDICAEYFVPFILSPFYTPRDANVVHLRTKSRSPIKYDLDDFGRVTTFDDINKRITIFSFLDMWSDHRLSQYHYWTTMGEAIYDAYEGAPEGLSVWTEYTKIYTKRCNRVPGYLSGGVASSCNRLYRTFKRNRITIKTIAWHAREDNPHAYERWHNDWLKDALEAAALTRLHVDVACALYRMYWLEFMTFKNGKTVHWYHFQESKLVKVSDTEILKLISTGFIRQFEGIAESLNSSSSGGDMDLTNIILNGINELIHDLKTRAYRSNIVSEVPVYFDCPQLLDYLDNNSEITGMEGQVLVATTQGCFTRTGRPEDYVTKSMGVGSYSDQYHDEHPDVLATEEWITQMFIEEDQCMHFKRFLASLLRGGNIDKRFFVMTGEGNNSKSMCVEAIARLYKDYCVKLGIAAFTRSRSDVNGPSPAFARTEATRIVFTEEPEGHVTLNSALINQLTGSDSFYSRKMKKNGKDVKPQFKLVMVCNKIPVLNGKAAQNRLSILCFNSTWTDDPPESEEEQYKYRLFKMNPAFESEIDLHKDPLFYISRRNYDDYLANGIRNEPEAIKDANKEYWERTDHLVQFAKDNFLHAVGDDGEPDMKYFVTLEDAYNSYKIWFKASSPGKKIPDRSTFLYEMEHRWGQLRNGKWFSIVPKSMAPDIEEETDAPADANNPYADRKRQATLLWGSNPLKLLTSYVVKVDDKNQSSSRGNAPSGGVPYSDARSKHYPQQNQGAFASAPTQHVLDPFASDFRQEVPRQEVFSQNSNESLDYRTKNEAQSYKTTPNHMSAFDSSSYDGSNNVPILYDPNSEPSGLANFNLSAQFPMV